MLSTAVGDDIWTVDGPEIVFAGAPMPTRMTVVRLDDGRLWIHSPIALTDEVEDFVRETGGEVCALIAPNKFHHLWVAEWRAHFPEARVFAESDLKRKVAALADAESILKDANAAVERAVREIKEAEAEKEATQLARAKEAQPASFAAQNSPLTI